MVATISPANANMKTRHRKHLLAKLRPGAWLRVSYGFERIDICQIGWMWASPVFENPKWGFNKCLIFDPRDLMSRNPQFLGYGKHRPIGSRIRRWTKYLCTIYTRPKL